MTVADLKAELLLELDVAVLVQRLLLKGKPLGDDAKPLREYGVVDGSNLTLQVGATPSSESGKKKPPPLPSEKESTIWSTTARVERPRNPEASPMSPSMYWPSERRKVSK